MQVQQMLVRSGPQGRLQANWTYMFTSKVSSLLLTETGAISSTAFTQCKGSAEPHRSPFIPSDGYSSPADRPEGGRVSHLSDCTSNLWQFSIMPPNIQPEKQECFLWALHWNTTTQLYLPRLGQYSQEHSTRNPQTRTPPSMCSL